MREYYDELKSGCVSAGIAIAGVMAFMYLIMLIIIFLFSGCGVNRISYKQTETRFMQKSDSLNLKVEPSKAWNNEKYEY